MAACRAVASRPIPGADFIIMRGFMLRSGSKNSPRACALRKLMGLVPLAIIGTPTAVLAEDAPCPPATPPASCSKEAQCPSAAPTTVNGRPLPPPHRPADDDDAPIKVSADESPIITATGPAHLKGNVVVT